MEPKQLEMMTLTSPSLKSMMRKKLEVKRFGLIVFRSLFYVVLVVGVYTNLI